MDKWRHIDGAEAVIDRPHIYIVLQHGDPEVVGVNGCRIEDLIDVLQDKLLDCQGRELACEENARALFHLEAAREELLERHRRRERQGVVGTRRAHVSPPSNATIDEPAAKLQHLS